MCVQHWRFTHASADHGSCRIYLEVTHLCGIIILRNISRSFGIALVLAFLEELVDARWLLWISILLISHIREKWLAEQRVSIHLLPAL